MQARFYDPQVGRTTKGGAVEYSVYTQAGTLLYSYKPGTGEVTDHVYLGSMPLVKVTSVGAGSPTVTYLHADLLNSPIQWSTASGAWQATEQYEPYGTKLNGVADKLGYTGHAHDFETDLTYMQARFYDAQVGRFLSSDPVEFDGSSPFTFNRYAYANNNPYRYVDPFGTTAYDCSNGNACPPPSDFQPGDEITVDGGSITIGGDGSFTITASSGYAVAPGLGQASASGRGAERDQRAAATEATASPEGDLAACRATCLQDRYGELYEGAGYFNPIAIPSVAAAATADVMERRGQAEGRRNVHGEMGTKGSRREYEMGRRRLRSATQLGRINAAASVLGAAALGFQAGAYGYCTVSCMGE